MADQSSGDLHLVGVIAEPLAAQLVPDELFGPPPLGAGVDVGQRGADDLVVDALTAQFDGQRSFTLARVDMSRLHPLFGEVLVVDQPDLGQPIEYPIADVLGVAALLQLPGQFGPGAGPHGEQAKTHGLRLPIALRSL